MAYALNPRFWLVVLVLFGLAFLRRTSVQWRVARAARRAARGDQAVKRP